MVLEVNVVGSMGVIVVMGEGVMVSILNGLEVMVVVDEVMVVGVMREVVLKLAKCSGKMVTFELLAGAEMAMENTAQNTIALMSGRSAVIWAIVQSSASVGAFY